jgi:hypothetical protein
MDERDKLSEAGPTNLTGHPEIAFQQKTDFHLKRPKLG